MPRRVRRPLALVIAPALLAPALVACGSDDGSQAGGDGLEAVEVSGQVGRAPQVEWTGDYSAGDLDSEVLVEGEGVEVTEDTDVMVHYWIGNGFDESEAISTYAAAPELIDLSDEELPAPLREPLVGQTVGSRVVSSVSAEEVFGEVGNPQFGISNKDPLLLVTDILGPTPVDVPYSEEGDAWVPDLVLDEDGQPEAMRFQGIPRPTGELRVETVVEGGGERIRKGDFIMADYLGSVYAKPKPFDGSFDAQPLVSPLSGLVPGWEQALVGATVGSRVWMALPPELGYGAEGNADAGIGGDDTIYFLVDVLGRAPQPDPAEVEPSTAPSADPTELPSGEATTQAPGSDEGATAPSDDES